MPSQRDRRIRHRPSTVRARRCGVGMRPGANYDPITPGKMDDPVSRIINGSLDGPVLPSTFRSVSLMRLDGFRAAGRVQRGFGESTRGVRRGRGGEGRGGEEGDIEDRKGERGAAYLGPSSTMRRHLISPAPSHHGNSSHNKAGIRARAATHSARICRGLKSGIFFSPPCIFGRCTHAPSRSASGKKAIPRITVYPLSERDARPTYDGVFISYAKR